MLSPETTLRKFLDETFVPDKRPAEHYLYQFKNAIKWLQRALRRPPKLRDLRRQTIDAAHESLANMGCSPSHVANQRRRLRTLWLYAWRVGAAGPCEYERQGGSDGSKPMPPPEGEPGTMVHFFRTTYERENILGKQTRASYFAFLRLLREFLGRDLLLAECSVEVLTAFCNWYGAQVRPISVWNRRRDFLAIWRLAHDRGLAPPVPRLKKFRIDREEPDSWTEEQVRAIVAATGIFADREIGNVRMDRWWRALLLVIWYTALRKSSALGIETRHLDLEGGWLYVPAAGMKNRCGKRYKLGADAMAALAEVIDPSRTLVFPQRDKRQLGKDFHLLLKRAGVPNGSRLGMPLFHKLRRSVASITAARVGLAAATALLGHSTADLLSRYIDPSTQPQNDSTAWMPSIG